MNIYRSYRAQLLGESEGSFFSAMSLVGLPEMSEPCIDWLSTYTIIGLCKEGGGGGACFSFNTYLLSG